jgi:hypothetical protein
VHGCMVSIGLSTCGTVICLDKRMMTGGPFETKVAQNDPLTWCNPTHPSRVRDSARALAACVTPVPELPTWVQSKCCTDVIFAGVHRFLHLLSVCTVPITLVFVSKFHGQSQVHQLPASLHKHS